MVADLVPACAGCGVQLRSASPMMAGKGPRWVVALLLAVATLLAGCGTVISLALGKPALKSSAVYSEAMTRARSSPQVLEELGQPLNEDWPVRGEIRRVAAGGYAEMAIPISGPKGTGQLSVIGNLVSGSWKISRLVLLQRGGKGKIDLSPPPTRESLKLPGSGKIFLVPLGRPTTYSLDDFPAYYQQKFGIEVEILPWVPLDPGVENPSRGQAVAEKLIDLMRRSEPAFSEDPDAFLIGISEKDMYIEAYSWRYAFNLRRKGRFAVVSTARMRSTSIPAPAIPEAAYVRLRKMLTKNIGILYYKLPLSSDPTSVLYGRIDEARDIDDMGEEFLGADGAWNPTPQSGVCVTITRTGRKQSYWKFDCGYLPPADTMAESFEVDLAQGLFVQSQTDFYIDEPFPLQLTRMYRPGDPWSRAFGIGTNHSLDIFLVGDAPKLSYIELILENGARIHFQRVSSGTGHINAEYVADNGSDNEFDRSFIRWNGNGWDLNRRDGWTFVFPASDTAKRPQQAALTGIHDSHGHAFKLVRNANGDLLHVTTPNANSIHFEYDSAGRVTRAKSNLGRYVVYHYDSSGRLMRVQDSAGRDQRYSFDSQNRMTAVQDGPGPPYLTNEYDAQGYVVRQTFDERRELAYRYVRKTDHEVMQMELTDPDGYVRRFTHGPHGFVQSLPEAPYR